MNETELIERCRSGDRAAFAALVEPSRTQVWAVCVQITGNRHDAEDALQDALIAAWQNLDKFRGTSRFGSWLYRIASNAALAIVRKRREIPDDEIDLGRTSTVPGPADRVVDTDAVRHALAQLPEQFRVAVVLREYAQMSYAEIAEHQNVPVATVKTRINRGRAQLVELLDPTRLDPAGLDP
ncbi:RNA polymerase sigma factor [Rhodococcus rhodochrous]|uniref:RNA polymerase sigma factor n=1 Tax=Rhodococcus rhodochrous TaxID=1829 RepID=UPI00132EF010|nr:sigma-70 family RNA polymerase sigma factor [Rhodococcus rhodochrous]QHG83591.1 sigma-70 family RNA polymerase sigma factor [Rhodococcus rhodochrous]QOH56729.1 RNA polymerase subunit sigma [Rhodococcus rhodochrous]